MSRPGVVPGEVTYCTLISAWEKGHRWRSGALISASEKGHRQQMREG